MIACLGCGFAAVDDFVFCPKCGTLLAGQRPPTEHMPTATRPALTEERKVVTTLFCDLVGFTALSEAHDHENVDAMLRTYASCTRAIAEAHGGVVEKFIGDAVVAVFGFPRAHDDDAERAVRAGLTIAREVPELDWPGDTPLAVRIGVNTGETYLHTDIAPASGETFLTGDAVNTAARLQSAAPPGGVVVGALTRQLTQRAIEYEELPAVTAKGKSEAVPAWHAKSGTRRVGVEVDRSRPGPMIGREAELGALRAQLGRTFNDGTPHFVLLVGEPGIGKSRLVRELSAHTDGMPEGIVWCETRCLAYGDTVAFQPLAEIVRACTGIREVDPPDVVDDKLDEIIGDDADAEWLRQRLRSLLGVESPSASIGENCIAWRRFLELVAGRGPLVVVIDDLHWSDDELLRFLSLLATTVHDVPLAVIGSARPELVEERSGLVADEFERLAIHRLGDGDVACLVASLFDAATVAEEVQTPILRQAAGNPLYAEEFVHLLQERELVTPTAHGLGLTDHAQIPIPDSLQAVIAARLDLLGSERKALLADASVVGSTFWAGSLLSLNTWRHGEVEAGLDELSTREFVSGTWPSTLPSDEEYVFWHALAHDVIYGQLPRAVRARKHAAAAGWFEERSPERLEDLVHHYITALDLAADVRDADLTRLLTEPAVRVLVLAGDRAMGIDVVRAEQRYSRALSLVGEKHPQRADLLARWASALESLGRLREAVDAYEQAIDGLRETGDTRAMAVVMEKRAFIVGSFNDDVAHTLAEEAHSLIRGLEPSPETAAVAAAWVGWLLCMERRDEALGAATDALEQAERLGLPLPAKALGFRGWARCEQGDRGGVDDYTVALEAAKAQGLGRETAMIYSSMGEVLAADTGPLAGFEVHLEGRKFAERRGIMQFVLWLGRAAIEDLVWAGQWDEALAAIDEIAPGLEEAEDLLDLISVRASRLLLDGERGVVQEESLTRWLEETGLGAQPEIDVCCYVAMALTRLRSGDVSGALEQLERFRTLPGAMGFERAWRLPTACRTALAAGDLHLAERLVEGVEPLMPVHEHALTSISALLTEARGDGAEAMAAFADAATRWHDFGVPYEEAQALLGQGRCLVALGRAPEAAAPLAAGREIFARLGAKPALTETDELLQRVASA